MEIKLFSIIVPHFNSPNLLRRLLESIHLCEDTEVIVVDDNSTDSLYEYSKLKNEYEPKGVIFLESNSEERSAGTCRNIGLKKATGKWVLFADADDYFSPDFRKIILDDVNREEDVIFYFPSSIDSATGKNSDRHVPFVDILQAYLKDRSEENELQIRFSLVAPWAKMIRRNLLLDNDILFETTRVANDVLFCRKVGVYSKTIAVSEKILYVVTTTPGSLTTAKNISSFEMRLEVFIRSTKFLRSHLDRKVYRKAHVNGSYFVHKCRQDKLGLIELIRTVIILIINGILPVNI